MYHTIIVTCIFQRKKQVNRTELLSFFLVKLCKSQLNCTKSNCTSITNKSFLPKADNTVKLHSWQPNQTCQSPLTQLMSYIIASLYPLLTSLFTLDKATNMITSSTLLIVVCIIYRQHQHEWMCRPFSLVYPFATTQYNLT